jgi:hypothetical protein
MDDVVCVWICDTVSHHCADMLQVKRSSVLRIRSLFNLKRKDDSLKASLPRYMKCVCVYSYPLCSGVSILGIGS